MSGVFSVNLQGLGTAPFLCWNQLELRLKVIRAKCLLRGKRASNIDPYGQINISIFCISDNYFRSEPCLVSTYVRLSVKLHDFIHPRSSPRRPNI